MKRVAIALTIAAVLSSVPVLAQDGPSDPGGACAVVKAFPLPQPMIDALLVLFGCEDLCADGSIPPCDG